MITTSEQLETYLESFTAFQKRATGHSLPWLRDLRESAFARFCEVGFPTTHDEDWRFTNVSAIAKTSFQLAPAGGHVAKNDLQQWDLPGAACQLVFVDGHFSPALSSVGELSGVKVTSLSEALKSNPSVLE